MWTAWFLRQLDPGVDVVLLEQDICGGGPSGRNGGFVELVLGRPHDAVRALRRRCGAPIVPRRRGKRHRIGAFCEAQGFDAWFRADGDLGTASSASQVGEWADAVITADRLGLITSRC